MAIQMAGLATGMDITSMVDSMVQAEKAPKEERITQRMQDIQTDISAYGRLKESLDAMKFMMADFRNNDALAARRTDISDPQQLSAVATPAAAVGRYSVDVQQLAQSHKLASEPLSASDSLGEGQLRIGLGTLGFEVTLESGQDKLVDLVRHINRAADNPGVLASIIKDDRGARLVLSSDQTGEQQQISVAVTASPVSDLQRLSYNRHHLSNAMNEMQPAQDARIVLDGLAIISSDTNRVSGAIEGVDLDIVALSYDEPTELAVSYDRQTVTFAIEQFVGAFNQFFDVTQALSSYDAQTQRGGPLTGDSLVRSVTNQLRQLFAQPVEGAPDNLQTLSQLGITTTLQGRLEIDYDVFSRQLNENFAGLDDFFGGRNGFARQVEDLIHSYTGITGSIRSREDSLSEQNTRLLTEQSKLDERMDGVKQRTYDRFSSMDAAMGQMQSQLAYMQGMFGGGG
ncbi:flagellar filament capping protein FliD [Thaumasiovibrio sp. DFM-14]|uniref:flagellar filament capping protein FliD n=1 Tax=Thaumasiovibrio sp. DFM-14 TaxID=3384792 RepID=UPI0039A04E52